jgi:hypothetical protein
MNMPQILRRHLLFVLLMMAAAAPLHAQGTDPSGNYRCDGTSPDGSAYRALVQIARNGDTYMLRWVTPGGVVSIGVGVVKDNMLSVAFFGISAGVVVYQIDGTKPLTGEWTDIEGKGQVYKETLTRLADGERISFPTVGPVF